MCRKPTWKWFEMNFKNLTKLKLKCREDEMGKGRDPGVWIWHHHPSSVPCTAGRGPWLPEPPFLDKEKDPLINPVLSKCIMIINILKERKSFRVKRMGFFPLPLAKYYRSFGLFIRGFQGSSITAFCPWKNISEVTYGSEARLQALAWVLPIFSTRNISLHARPKAAKMPSFAVCFYNILK